jgi:hypothetical protein
MRKKKEILLKIKHIKGLAELFKCVLLATYSYSIFTELKCRTIEDFIDFIERHPNEIETICKE